MVIYCIYSEGFSALEKNAMICSQRAMQTILLNDLVSCHIPLQRVMAVWHTFFEMWTFWVGCDSPLQTIMAVWHVSNIKKYAPNGHYYLLRAVTPDQITQQNSLHWQEGLKGSKRHFEPDFQANTTVHLGIFLKPMLSQEGGCKEIQV